jgi:hypothetical protein
VCSSDLDQSRRRAAIEGVRNAVLAATETLPSVTEEYRLCCKIKKGLQKKLLRWLHLKEKPMHEQMLLQ